MVFKGFGFFKAGPSEMKMSELPLFLLGKFDQQRRDLENKLAAAAADITNQFRAVNVHILELSQKSSQQTYANTIKNKFCEKSIESIQKLPEYSGTYESLKKFIAAAGDTMHIIGGMNLKEFRHLHAFRDDMSKIAEKIKSLESEIGFANKLMRESVLARIDDINQSVTKVEELKKSLKRKDAEIGEAKADFARAKDAVTAVTGGVEDLNRKFSEYAAEKTRIKDQDRKADGISQRVDSEFSGMDRIFKKFLYFGNLSKEENNLLKDYIASPGYTFLEKDEKSEIRAILDQIYYFRDRNLIELDESKRGKVEDLIRHFAVLLELRDQYRQAKQSKEFLEREFESKMEPIMKEIRERTGEIDSRQKEVGAMEMKLKTKEIERRVAEKEIENTKNRIELSMTQLLNRNMKIIDDIEIKEEIIQEQTTTETAKLEDSKN